MGADAVSALAEGLQVAGQESGQVVLAGDPSSVDDLLG
jgi:hypothetical protein